MEGNKLTSRHHYDYCQKTSRNSEHENVALELECIDRMYLNLYVPELTSAQGVAAYFRCRTPIQRQTERPAFVIGFRCCRRSFPSLRFGIARHGREFFEEVIRENIDLGRPETVQLIFARKMRKSTVAGGRCRTRIATEGVIPSLHVYYKNTHIKQYHKTGRRGAGLRTETTINNTYDFGVGRLLGNLPKLREIGFAANRRMLEVEKASHDCRVGAKTFEMLQSPASVEGQRASALRFGDARVQALLQCSCCSAFSSRASSTGNCGHYLRRCSAWKKTTSVRAA